MTCKICGAQVHATLCSPCMTEQLKRGQLKAPVLPQSASTELLSDKAADAKAIKAPKGQTSQLGVLMAVYGQAIEHVLDAERKSADAAGYAAGFEAGKQAAAYALEQAWVGGSRDRLRLDYLVDAVLGAEAEK